MCHAFACPQRLKLLSTKHLAEGVRGIHGTVDNNVGDMYALWAKLSIQLLAQHTPAAHGRGV